MSKRKERKRVMRHDNPVEYIIKCYYPEILRYCRMQLQGDTYAAEDCTQEVFLLLYQKIDTLDLHIDLRPWLYAVADRKIKAYYRKNPKMIDITAISEQEQTVEFDFETAEGNILDKLDQEEQNLIKSYFSGEDKNKIAENQGISISALYMKISRIKKKILKILEK